MSIQVLEWPESRYINCWILRIVFLGYGLRRNFGELKSVELTEILSQQNKKIFKLCANVISFRCNVSNYFLFILECQELSDHITHVNKSMINLTITYKLIFSQFYKNNLIFKLWILIMYCFKFMILGIFIVFF